MSRKKLFVFGSNSFSGQDFIDNALEVTDYSIFGISRSPQKSNLFLKYLSRDLSDRFEFHQLDMNDDIDGILALLDREQPNLIVNFAAQSEVAPSWDHPEHWFETNTVSLCKIVNHLRQRDYVERYLHISSPEAYGNCEGQIKEGMPDNPSTPYAASKSAADMILKSYQQQFDFPAMYVRATNVYGARQQLFKIIPRSAIYMRSGQTIQLHGGGVAEKSFIHVRDVSRGELKILEKGTIGQMYHLSPDAAVSVRKIVETVAGCLDKNFSDCVEIVDERPGQDARYWIDSSLARTSLDWSPEIDLEQGIAEVISWTSEYWQEISEQPLEYIHKQ